MNKQELIEMFLDTSKEIKDIERDIKDITIRLMSVMQQLNQYNILTLSKSDGSK